MCVRWSASLVVVALWPALALAQGTATLQGKRLTVERKVVSTKPNRFRSDYAHLQLERGQGEWFFRDEVHGGASRTQQELAYFHTSRDLGLRVVPRLVKGTWNGRSGTLQRVIPDAMRSAGHMQQDAFQAQSSPDHVDWDSLHALAIQHYVTSMHDDAPYNVLLSRSSDGKLTYHAIDGERAFGRNQGFARSYTARRLVEQSFATGGPRQLSDALWQRIRKTDVVRWRQHLAESGLPPEAIDRAVRHLEKVKELGLQAILNESIVAAPPPRVSVPARPVVYYQQRWRR